MIQVYILKMHYKPTNLVEIFLASKIFIEMDIIMRIILNTFALNLVLSVWNYSEQPKM